MRRHRWRLANFVGLAEGTRNWISTNGAVKAEPFYDGLIFHRVIDGFMIQGGCPLGNGTSGPGYKFPDQISTNILHSKAGVLSMANSGPDSNGSQFFITLDQTSWLDGKHAVFGDVVDGMNTVSNIGVVAVDASRPLTNVVMNSVNILRIGPAAEAFDPADQPLPEVMPLSVVLTNSASGLEVVAASSNQVEFAVYSSTNLQQWAKSAGQYFPEAVGPWAVPAATNRPCEFFRGGRVAYSQEVTEFADIVGSTLTFAQGASVLVFNPNSSGGGACSIVGNPDNLADWADWTSGPFPGIVFFQLAGHTPFYFTLSVDGSCEGHQWKWTGFRYEWISLGLFEFSKTRPDA